MASVRECMAPWVLDTGLKAHYCPPTPAPPQPLLFQSHANSDPPIPTHVQPALAGWNRTPALATTIRGKHKHCTSCWYTTTFSLFPSLHPPPLSPCFFQFFTVAPILCMHTCTYIYMAWTCRHTTAQLNTYRLLHRSFSTAGYFYESDVVCWVRRTKLFIIRQN